MEFGRLGMEILRGHGVYMDLKDAVQELRPVRLMAAKGFIPPTSPGTRDEYPFRNKIGEICVQQELLGWGYHFTQGHGSRKTVCWMWVGKVDVHCRRGELGRREELSDRQLQMLEVEGTIDYVAVGQRAPDRLESAWFDEAIQDFVFDGKGGRHREEDRI
jgi:hypothetical protein